MQDQTLAETPRTAPFVWLPQHANAATPDMQHQATTRAPRKFPHTAPPAHTPTSAPAHHPPRLGKDAAEVPRCAATTIRKAHTAAAPSIRNQIFLPVGLQALALLTAIQPLAEEGKKLQSEPLPASHRRAVAYLAVCTPFCEPPPLAARTGLLPGPMEYRPQRKHQPKDGETKTRSITLKILFKYTVF